MDNKEEVVIIENNEKNEQESTKQNNIDESQEFIPLEELDAIKQSTISQEEQISHEPKEKKLNKRLIILISAGLLGAVLLVMILFLLLNKNEEPAQNEPPIQTEPVKPIENSYKIDIYLCFSRFNLFFLVLPHFHPRRRQDFRGTVGSEVGPKSRSFSPSDVIFLCHQREK